MNGVLVIRFEPQASPHDETCVRCAQLARPSVIRAGALHAAVIEDARQMDTRARVILCTLCEFFVRDALTTNGE